MTTVLKAHGKILHHEACEFAEATHHTVCVCPDGIMNELGPWVDGCEGCLWSMMVAVVAHEMARTLDPYLDSRHPWDSEYHADETVGWVLGVLDLDPEVYMSFSASLDEGPMHPPGKWRVARFVKGFRAGADARRRAAAKR